MIIDQFEGPRHVADDGCRSSVVHHDRRAVGGAGAGGRVMAAANTTPLASGLRNGDDGLEQHKGPVGWTARAFDSTHRSSAGESGTESYQPPPDETPVSRIQAGPELNG